MKTVVIGGGISGLLAAHRLKEIGEVILLEATERYGGWVDSEIIEGRLFEWGPHTLMAGPDWLEILEKLHLKPIFPGPQHKTRFIRKNGRNLALPMGLISLLTTPLIGPSAKWRALTEFFRTHKIEEADLSLYDFFERCFHQDVSDFVVSPFVHGVYAGDAKKLSTKASMPKIWEAVQAEGSVLRGLKKTRGPKKHSISFKGGLGELTKALWDYLPNKELNSPVTSISKSNLNKWKIHTSRQEIVADQVVIATPAPIAANLLSSLIPESTYSFLNQIEYIRVGLLNAVFDRPKDFQPAFGVLIPPSEKMDLLGSLWISETFAGRCPEEELITANFFSGENIPENPRTEFQSIMKVIGTRQPPKFFEWRVHERAIPQYRLTHADQISRLRKSLPDGVYLQGNYLDAISLSAMPEQVEKLIRLIKRS